MQSTITAIRAIGVEYAKRFLRPLIIIGGVMAVMLLALGGWLTAQSAWWWLLQAFFIICTVVFVLLAIATSIILRVLAPELTKSQRRSVRDFVDKLEAMAETIQTPQIFIIYQVVRDTIWPRKGGFIETVSRDSKALGPEFTKLRRELDRP